MSNISIADEIRHYEGILDYNDFNITAATCRTGITQDGSGREILYMGNGIVTFTNTSSTRFSFYYPATLAYKPF